MSVSTTWPSCSRFERKKPRRARAGRGFVLEVFLHADDGVQELREHAGHRVRALVVGPAFVDALVHDATWGCLTATYPWNGTFHVRVAPGRAVARGAGLAEAELAAFAVLETLLGDFTGTERAVFGLRASPHAALVPVDSAVLVTGDGAEVEALCFAGLAVHVVSVAFLVAVDGVVAAVRLGTSGVAVTVSTAVAISIAVPSRSGVGGFAASVLTGGARVSTVGAVAFRAASGFSEAVEVGVELGSASAEEHEGGQ